VERRGLGFESELATVDPKLFVFSWKTLVADRTASTFRRLNACFQRTNPIARRKAPHLRAEDRRAVTYDELLPAYEELLLTL
jgi:hypothetical protein